jgi:hypothetical protein
MLTIAIDMATQTLGDSLQLVRVHSRLAMVKVISRSFLSNCVLSYWLLFALYVWIAFYIPEWRVAVGQRAWLLTLASTRI